MYVPLASREEEDSLDLKCTRKLALGPRRRADGCAHLRSAPPRPPGRNLGVPAALVAAQHEKQRRGASP